MKKQLTHLTNEEVDHGTFLEIVKLLRKYDPCTADHLSHIVQSVKALHVYVRRQTVREVVAHW